MAKLTIDQALQQGITAHKAGQIQEADRLYTAILKAQPKHPDANHNIGVLAVDVGQTEQALSFFKTALEANPNNAQFWLSYINALIKVERLADAKTLFDQAKSHGAQGDGFDQLEERLSSPDQAKLNADQGISEAFERQSNILDALKLDQALRLAEKKVKEALPEAAEHIYRDILAKFPKNKKASDGLRDLSSSKNGKASKGQNPSVEQVQSVLNLYSQRLFQQALEQATALLQNFPNSSVLYNISGAIYQRLGQLGASVEAYNQALTIKPDYAEAYNNMGVTLKEQGKLDEAIEAYNQALTIKPDHVDAYNNMGNALIEQGKLDEAIEAYNKALTIKPDYAETRATILHQQSQICDWDSIAKNIQLLPGLGTIEGPVPPFTILSLEDAPERHRIRSEVFAKSEYSQKSMPACAKPLKKSKRLKIGYFSADFHDHATMYLMTQIFSAHDHESFKVYAYSYGPEKHDEMRQKLIADVDQFYDVRNMSNGEIVELARADNLDIAIDLKGYTKDNRLVLFASRLAPIQISYLGYPGTLGTDFIDYIIADSTLIPEDKRRYYTEQVIYLPNTYQPTDDTRRISNNEVKREDLGLPSEAFVFCCFNNNYKISPAEFDIWMRLLRKVEGSVLWLLRSNKWAEKNLKQQAEARGISSERLVFADKLPQAEHLARQRLADIFIDTFNYNAHTTASDALWVGLPVVTKLGEGFAARVAGSLLNAVGLPELITTTEKDYEDLIIELATNSTKLNEINGKLLANRLSLPLFNTALYVKHLENGYQQAYQHYFNGRAPQAIYVPQ